MEEIAKLECEIKNFWYIYTMNCASMPYYSYNKQYYDKEADDKYNELVNRLNSLKSRVNSDNNV